MGSNTSTKRVKQKVRPTERITVGLTDTVRRDNLLTNMRQGHGSAKQVGTNVLYVVGSENFGYIEYLILMPNVQKP